MDPQDTLDSHEPEKPEQPRDRNVRGRGTVVWQREPRDRKQEIEKEKQKEKQKEKEKEDVKEATRQSYGWRWSEKESHVAQRDEMRTKRGVSEQAHEPQQPRSSRTVAAVAVASASQRGWQQQPQQQPQHTQQPQQPQQRRTRHTDAGGVAGRGVKIEERGQSEAHSPGSTSKRRGLVSEMAPRSRSEGRWQPRRDRHDESWTLPSARGVGTQTSSPDSPQATRPSRLQRSRRRSRTPGAKTQERRPSPATRDQAVSPLRPPPPRPSREEALETMRRGRVQSGESRRESRDAHVSSERKTARALSDNVGRRADMDSKRQREARQPQSRNQHESPSPSGARGRSRPSPEPERNHGQAPRKPRSPSAAPSSPVPERKVKTASGRTGRGLRFRTQTRQAHTEAETRVVPPSDGQTAEQKRGAKRGASDLPDRSPLTRRAPRREDQSTERVAKRPRHTAERSTELPATYTATQRRQPSLDRAGGARRQAVQDPRSDDVRPRVAAAVRRRSFPTKRIVTSGKMHAWPQDDEPQEATRSSTDNPSHGRNRVFGSSARLGVMASSRPRSATRNWSRWQGPGHHSGTT